jgi:hypothetical protein
LILPINTRSNAVPDSANHGIGAVLWHFWWVESPLQCLLQAVRPLFLWLRRRWHEPVPPCCPPSRFPYPAHRRRVAASDPLHPGHTSNQNAYTHCSISRIHPASSAPAPRCGSRLQRRGGIRLLRPRIHYETLLAYVAAMFNTLLRLNRTLQPEADPQDRLLHLAQFAL